MLWVSHLRTFVCLLLRSAKLNCLDILKPIQDIFRMQSTSVIWIIFLTFRPSPWSWTNNRNNILTSKDLCRLITAYVKLLPLSQPNLLFTHAKLDQQQQYTQMPQPQYSNPAYQSQQPMVYVPQAQQRQSKNEGSCLACAWSVLMVYSDLDSFFTEERIQSCSLLLGHTLLAMLMLPLNHLSLSTSISASTVFILFVKTTCNHAVPIHASQWNAPFLQLREICFNFKIMLSFSSMASSMTKS